MTRLSRRADLIFSRIQETASGSIEAALEPLCPPEVATAPLDDVRAAFRRRRRARRSATMSGN